MEIRAALSRERGAPMVIEDVTIEEPRADEVRVRVVATGVCHADLFMRDQVYPVSTPVVLGHEGAGIVEKVGSSVTSLEVGDHVVMTYNSCGTCVACLRNLPGYCHDAYARNFACSRPDGSSPLARPGEQVHAYFFGQSSFAEYAICRERNAIKVPQDADLAGLGPLACGIQTGAGAITDALRVPLGATLAVFGTGSVGLAAVMAAAAVGVSTIVAVDVSAERLRMAESLGATVCLNASEGSVAAALRRVLPQGVDFALDTTGSPRVVRDAVDVLAPRGVCGTVGGNPRGTAVELDLNELMATGKTLRGIVEGDVNSRTYIPHLIELHRQGRFPMDRLTTFYALDEINDAASDMEAGRVVKPVLLMAHQ